MEKPVFNNVENECTRTEDGREVFLARDCAISVPVSVMDSEGNLFVLVSKRGEDTPNYQFHINLVCGYLDRNETLVEAAKRELWEEVGLHVDAIPKENIIYDIDQLPWAIGDKSFTGKQNVTMRFGLLAKFDSVEDFPKLTIENAMEGEVLTAEWVSHEEAMKFLEATEETDPHTQDVWAFNHHKVFREWVDKIDSL